MIPFSLEEVAALCPGRLDAAPWADEVTGVQIDSRRIEEGDLFIAVGGGEDFCRHALRRQSISPWAIGSPCWTRWLRPRATRCSPCVSTLPMGQPPSLNPARASS